MMPVWFFTFVFAGELLRHTLGSERKEPLRKKGNRMLGGIAQKNFNRGRRNGPGANALL